MRKSYFLIVSKINLSFLLILFSGVLFSQSQAISSKTKSEFWKNVQFGEGFELIEIYSKSYGENPIVIQCAGVGKEIKARGVLADILKLSEITKKHRLILV